jgi:hypothetical protein
MSKGTRSRPDQFSSEIRHNANDAITEREGRRMLPLRPTRIVAFNKDFGGSRQHIAASLGGARMTELTFQ